MMALHIRQAVLTFLIVVFLACSSATAQAPNAEQLAAQTLQDLLQTYLSGGERSRQPASGHAFHLGPYKSAAIKHAEDGSGRIVGASLVVEQDLGCGCCYENIPIELSEQHFQAIAALTGLEQLDLSYAKFNPRHLEYLKSLNNLESLILSHLPLGDDSMLAVGKLSTLKHLSLEYTNVTDAGLASLAKLTNLGSLSLSGSKVTGSGLQSLSDLPNLRVVQGYPVQAVPGLVSIKALARLQGRFGKEGVSLLGPRPLERIYLYGDRERGLVRIEGLSKLTDLSIGVGSQLELRDLPSVTNFSLSGIVLDSHLRQASEAMPAIETLSLTLDEGSDRESLRRVADLKSLKLLRLSGSDLRDDALAMLRLPKSLVWLSIAGEALAPSELPRLLREAHLLEELKLRGLSAAPEESLRIAGHLRLRDLEIRDSSLNCLELLSLDRLERLRFDGDSRVREAILSGLSRLPISQVMWLREQASRESAPEIGEIQLRDAYGHEWRLEKI